ncbi:MAG: restriction endonuclease subunit S [Roseomonas sp.]|jgi:type I restriction enzyme S subunit|nr:restriction endonuclease subunit S [Roseomonas sp.]MCA3296809.1 restriction endonuclease subunit S [Roseomonas sp.]
MTPESSAATLPCRWTWKKLKHVAWMAAGDAITSEEIFESGDYPVYGGNGLRGYTDQFNRKGDFVLIGRQGALCGNINYASGAFWASEHAIAADLQGNAEVRWLGQLLSSMNLNQYSQSAAQPGIAVDVIANLPIPVPPRSAQLAIARFLDRETTDIDALINAKQRLLELLAEKRRAIIAEAVMRGLNPAAPLRPSGIDWLGDIPAHWEVRRIATLFTQRDERQRPELPLLEVSINSGVIIREFSNDKIEGTASDFNVYKVAQKNDIAFNKMRMWQGAVGVSPVDGLVSPDYTVANPAPCLRPEYAGLLFRTDSFSAECGRNSQGITWDRLRLYWDGFRDIFMPLPPLPEQDAILEAVQAETTKIDRLCAATEHSITLLKERRSALIAAAVTGQIDIPEAA